MSIPAKAPHVLRERACREAGWAASGGHWWLVLFLDNVTVVDGVGCLGQTHHVLNHGCRRAESVGHVKLSEGGWSSRRVRLRVHLVLRARAYPCVCVCAVHAHVR